MLLYMDTETFSELDLRKTNAARYAEDCRVLLLSYGIDEAPVRVWDLTLDPTIPADLKDAWSHVLEDEDSFFVIHNGMSFDGPVIRAQSWAPALPAEKIIDLMVVAYEHGFPGSLDELCTIFAVKNRKQTHVGHNLIPVFCKPQPAGRRTTVRNRITDPEKWALFIEYCRLDTEAMRDVWKKLPRFNLTSWERGIQLLDERINRRGIRIDTSLSDAAIRFSKNYRAELNAKTHEVTGGAVLSGMQTLALKDYLQQTFGIEIEKLNKATCTKLLEDEDVPEAMKELLRLRLFTAKNSVAKFEAATRLVCHDGRVRGTLQFRGAQRTGRWSGRGLQVQNLPRPSMKARRVELCIQCVKRGLLEAFFPEDPIRALSECIRGLIIPAPEKKFVVADFSNVEGRVLAWYAGEEWKLQAFRDADAGHGVDLYKVSYGKAFSKNPADVTHDERQIGKVIELGLGYGGGVNAFVTFANGYGIDLHSLVPGVKANADPDLWDAAERYYPIAEKNGNVPAGMEKNVFIACDTVKRAWRKANSGIEACWHKTFDACSEACYSGHAVELPRGCVVDTYKDFLRIRLPSGRYLCYCRPEFDDGDMYFLGIGRNHKWGKRNAHAGQIVENIIQAIACDLLTNALVKLEAHGYATVFTVHDEAICEVPDDPAFNVDQMKRLMCALPDWGAGLPLAAAGFEAKRYRKD